MNEVRNPVFFLKIAMTPVSADSYDQHWKVGIRSLWLPRHEWQFNLFRPPLLVPVQATA
jgi:hypothetical protein